MQIFGSRLLIAIRYRGQFENVTIQSRGPSANVPGCSRPPVRSRRSGDLRYPRRRRRCSLRASSASAEAADHHGHRRPNPARLQPEPSRTNASAASRRGSRQSAAAICTSSRPAISFHVGMDLSVPTAGKQSTIRVTCISRLEEGFTFSDDCPFTFSD